MGFIVILAGLALAGPLVGIVQTWVRGRPTMRRLVRGGLWGGVATGVLTSGLLLALPHASFDAVLLAPVPIVAAAGAMMGLIAGSLMRLFRRAMPSSAPTPRDLSG